MSGHPQPWADAVERHFGFLDAFGFRSSGTEERSHWETSVVYTSRQVAVKVSLSREFGRAEVDLVRLVDGEVPPYPIWITEEVLNWTLLDNVIEARRPDLSAQIPSGGLQEDELERQLETWAELLRLVAPEFLENNPSAIDDAAVVIRRRVGEHPQHLTVWLPEHTPSDADRDVVGDMRGSVPPNVDVSVARYSRWRRRRSG